MTEKTDEKLIRIIWGSLENTPISYANQVHVSFAGGTEFHVTFGYVEPPIGDLDESEVPEKLVIKPIISIVASPEVMKNFVDVINLNFSNYQRFLSGRSE